MKLNHVLLAAFTICTIGLPHGEDNFFGKSVAPKTDIPVSAASKVDGKTIYVSREPATEDFKSSGATVSDGVILVERPNRESYISPGKASDARGIIRVAR